MSAQSLSTPQWSADEDARLRRLVEAGPIVLDALVPHLSGRSASAIVARLRRLDLCRRVDLTDYHRSRYRRYRPPAPDSTRRWMRWSQQEDGMLRRAAADRLSLDELQERLPGRTGAAIVSRLRTLGLADRIAGTHRYFAAWSSTRTDRPASRQPKRRRPCLHCRKIFRSAGPQNRLCEPCREYAADISPFDIWP